MTTPATIARRAETILAEIDQLIADVNELGDTDLIFDIATRLGTTRQPLLISMGIAAGAAEYDEQEGDEAASAWMAAARQSERHACGAY